MLINREKAKQYRLNIYVVIDFAKKSVGKTVKSVSNEFVRKKAFEIYNQNPRLHLVV
jgi:hypothetical protein